MKKIKTSEYFEKVTESILSSRKRNRELSSLDIDSSYEHVISPEDVMKLTKKNEYFFKTIIRDNVSNMEKTWNTNHSQDFGTSKKLKALYTHNPQTNMVTLYTIFLVKGISNKFIYKHKTEFFLNNDNKIIKTNIDDKSYLLSLIGNNKTLIKSVDKFEV